MYANLSASEKLPCSQKRVDIVAQIRDIVRAVEHDIGCADAVGGAASPPTVTVTTASMVTANVLNFVTVPLAVAF